MLVEINLIFGYDIMSFTDKVDLGTDISRRILTCRHINILKKVEPLILGHKRNYFLPCIWKSYKEPIPSKKIRRSFLLHQKIKQAKVSDLVKHATRRGTASSSLVGYLGSLSW
jgi:hypothetical protein